MESNGTEEILQQAPEEKACKKYYQERISNVNFKVKLELQYVKLPHFFNQLGTCIILYLLANYLLLKQSLRFFPIIF